MKKWFSSIFQGAPKRSRATLTTVQAKFTDFLDILLEFHDILRDAGFADAWLHSTSHQGRGYTCCHDKDLMNGIVSMEERIDFMLYRSDDPHGFSIPGPVHMTILGDEDGDQTDDGLWPADHAALFGGFTVPPGLAR